MSDSLKQQNLKLAEINEDYESKYGFHDPVDYFHKGAKGLNHEVVEMISKMKKEPRWMTDWRHEALDIFYAEAQAGLPLGRHPVKAAARIIKQRSHGTGVGGLVIGRPPDRGRRRSID